MIEPKWPWGVTRNGFTEPPDVLQEMGLQSHQVYDKKCVYIATKCAARDGFTEQPIVFQEMGLQSHQVCPRTWFTEPPSVRREMGIQSHQVCDNK